MSIINPHLFLLSKAMRPRQAILNPALLAMATRGGGGGFHKPDPKLPKLYQHTRVIHLEDINTVLYHDHAPEYHMHLHSPWVQNAKQGWSLLACYFFLIIVPIFALGITVNKKVGACLFPSLRPGKDHAHMGPRLISHLKEVNYENKTDALGRRTGTFYMNFARQIQDMSFTPSTIKALESHGFKF